jgi:hypothetical protein
VRQSLTGAEGTVTDQIADNVQTAATKKRVPRFKKQPDTPLGEILASKAHAPES